MEYIKCPNCSSYTNNGKDGAQLWNNGYQVKMKRIYFCNTCGNTFEEVFIKKIQDLKEG